MIRTLYAIALLATLILGAGCAMCEPPQEHQPSAFGGVCADGACGHRVGSIIAGACGSTVAKVVEGDGEYLESAEPIPADPLPAGPLEVPDEMPLGIEPEASLIPIRRADSMLEAPTPDLGLFPAMAPGPTAIESGGYQTPLPAEAGEATVLPLGPPAVPPLPGN